jgi:hypothetical protein
MRFGEGVRSGATLAFGNFRVAVDFVGEFAKFAIGREIVGRCGGGRIRRPWRLFAVARAFAALALNTKFLAALHFHGDGCPWMGVLARVKIARRGRRSLQERSYLNGGGAITRESLAG